MEQEHQLKSLLTEQQFEDAENKEFMLAQARACANGYALATEGIAVVSDFQNNDILLLCSDGLTDMLDDNILQQIFTKAESVQQATNLLVKYALKAGGHDNVTVLCLRYRTKKLAGQKN